MQAIQEGGSCLGSPVPAYCRANYFGLSLGLSSITAVMLTTLEAIAIANYMHGLTTNAFTVSMIKTPVTFFFSFPGLFQTYQTYHQLFVRPPPISELFQEEHLSIPQNRVQEWLVHLAERFPLISSKQKRSLELAKSIAFLAAVALQLGATYVAGNDDSSSAIQSCVYISGWVICQFVVFSCLLCCESQEKTRRSVLVYVWG